LKVSQVGLPSFVIQTAMSDSKSINTSLFEVMIPSKNECVSIGDISDLTQQLSLMLGERQ